MQKQWSCLHPHVVLFLFCLGSDSTRQSIPRHSTHEPIALFPFPLNHEWVTGCMHRRQCPVATCRKCTNSYDMIIPSSPESCACLYKTIAVMASIIIYPNV